MTPEDIDAAVRARGMGFDMTSERVVSAGEAHPTYCNKVLCACWASVADATGTTADEIAVLIELGVNGDLSGLRALASAAKG